MAISAAGQALAQKNKANRQQFAQATAMPKTTGVTPEAQANLDTLNTRANGDAIGDMAKFGNPNAPKVTDKFTKENFLKMSGAGTNPATTPTPLGTTNTSEGLNIVGAPHPSTIIQPGNTTGELPNTTITQTSGQTGVNSPFASGNKTNTTTPTTPTTPTQTVEGSVADSIANANKAIADEKAGLKSVQDATKDAISTAAASKEALIGAEEKFARDKAMLNQQKMSDLQLSQAEYVNEQERQKTEALTTIQPLVDAERAANRAALNVAAAKAEEGEYNATVANDVAMQQANVAFAKMGMSFTGSAIATTQSLHKEGALKIASLKADNAYKYAGLQKEMNAVEVGHQIKVNSIIATANENIVARREKTRDKISSIQENVIMTEKEKVQNIEKIKNEYADFRLKSETTVYGQVRDSNKEVQRNLDAITAKLDKDKVDAKAQIQSLVRNGQWDKLSATKQKELSTRSGMSIGEVEGEKTSAVYAAVNTQLQAIVGSNITVSPESSKKIFDAASAYVSMGYNINTAIQKAIQLNASKIPEIAQSKQLETKTNALKLSQAEANLAQTNANIKQTYSNIGINETKSNIEVNKAKAEASAAKNPWTTSGVDVDGYVIQSNKDTGAIRKVRPEEFKTPEQWANTKGTGLLDAPDGTIIPSRLSDSGNPNGGKACGEFANDATGRINVGQTASARKAAFTDTTAKVGGQVFFEGDGYDSTYGHVAVVTGVSPDGKTMTIKESNRTGNGEVGERTIPTSQATGFYNNTDLAKTAEVKGVRNSIEEMTISGKNEDLANTALNAFGITNADTVTKDAALAVINSARKQGLSPNEAKAGVRDVLKNSGLLSPLKTMSEGELAAINSPDDYKTLFNKFAEASKVDRDILKRDLNTLTAFGDDIGSATVGQYYIEPTYDAEFKPDGGFEIKKKTQSEDEWFSTEDDGESVMIIPPKSK